MLVFNEVIRQLEEINEKELHHYIENEWVKPIESQGTYHFSEIDIARARLVWELRYSLKIEEESLSLILSLMDQLYTTRRQLKHLLLKLQEDNRGNHEN